MSDPDAAHGTSGTRAVGVGIVGAGNIARAYARDVDRYEGLELVAVADLDVSRAEAVAGEVGTRAHGSLDDLLSDDQVDLVINSTVFAAHAEVTRRCLLAGRHVYSEKPLALNHGEAASLIELARRRGLQLACAPCNLLGEAQQTAWRFVREGHIGTVRTVSAEAHGGRIELWHPMPGPFLEVGPLADLAIYPLTLVTAMLGAVCEVQAAGMVLRPERTALDGSSIPISTPDHVVAILGLVTGAMVRLTTSFDLPRHGRNTAGVEFHGDEGRLYLADWQLFDAAVESASPTGSFQPVPLVRTPEHEVEHGRGVQEMAEAIAVGRQPRASAEQAAHLVDVIGAISDAVRSGGKVEVASAFVRPDAMPWAEQTRSRRGA
jgi:predicted dehydrogenase